MIRLTISPKEKENLYGLMVQRERSLRKQNRGTLHRYGTKKKDEEKWGHTSKHGWIRFQRCIGQVVVATAQAREQTEEWELLQSFTASWIGRSGNRSPAS